MKFHGTIHQIAIIGLVVVMVHNMVDLCYPVIEALPIIIYGMIFDAMLWGLLIYKIATKPRQWGLGVGIFLSILLIFQVSLWIVAMTGPAHDRLGIFTNIPIFIILEFPVLITAVCCFMLRRFTPRAPCGGRLLR